MEYSELVSSIDRNNTLYEQITEGEWKIDGVPRGPRAPDKRNIAALLFFSIASHWEAFCTSVFELELKQRYHVQQSVARSIMNYVDDAWRHGGQVSGYGQPELLVKRAESLLSRNSPWVTFQNVLGTQSYQYLWHGYKIRNYIAHSGMGKGREEWLGLLNGLGIPGPSRRGMSAGRLLLDYPMGAGPKWFEILPSNYKAIANYVLGKSR